MYPKAFHVLFPPKLHFSWALLSEYDCKQVSLAKSSLLIRFGLTLSMKNPFVELLHKLDL